jgi:hypothetical protein
MPEWVTLSSVPEFKPLFAAVRYWNFVLAFFFSLDLSLGLAFFLPLTPCIFVARRYRLYRLVL